MKPCIVSFIGIILVLLVSFPINVLSQEQVSNGKDVFEMSLEDLMNQDVTTVSKSVEKMLDAPGIIEVVTREDIKKFGGTTLSAILERIPGLIATTSAVSDRSIISFRGEQTTANSNHVLLLIDGRPVRETLEGGINSEMYESFPVNIIDKIEVIKGPGSVLYGSNAFSGVINIITQKVEKTNVMGSVLSGYSGTIGANFNLNIKTSDLKVVAAGRYLKKPDWKTNYSYDANSLSNSDSTTTPVVTSPTVSGVDTTGNSTITQSSGDSTINTGQNNPQMLNSDINIPNQSASLFLSAAYKNLSFTTSFNQWKTTGFDSPGIAKWQKSFNNLGYNLNFNEKWKSTLNVSFTNTRFETDSFPDVHRNSYELLTEWTHFVTLSEKSKIVFGGLYALTQGKETNTISGIEEVGIDARRGSVAIYAQADYQLLKTLKFTGGVQLNKIENIDLNMVPRIAIIWNPSSHFNFKMMYGQAFRAPSLNECYLDQPFMQGNSSLEPEKVGTIDIGANYIGEHLQLTLNFFHSNLSHIITLDQSYSTPTYNNLDTVVFQGGEFEGKYYLNKNIYLTGSVLYQTNENGAGDTNVTPIANLSSKAGISYQSDDGISVSLFDIYQGALDDSYKTDSNVSPESAYNKLNLHCDFDLNKLMKSNIRQQINLYLHADNLLNREIWLPALGSDSGKSIPFDQGRVIYAGLSIVF